MLQKMFLLSTLFFTIIFLSGCGTQQPISHNQPEPGANPTTPENTTLDFDSDTTTHNGSDQLAVSAIVEPGIMLQKTAEGKTTTVATPSYTAAINDYGSARFQFSLCRGTPGQLTVKKGTTFMLDNRDNDTHQFTIGPNSYELKAYDFALVQIQKAGDYFITCDGGGSAKITIQN